MPEDNTKFTAAGAQRERVPQNNFSQRVKTRLNIASGADQETGDRTPIRIETYTEAVPLLPPRKTLPAGTTIRLPEGGQLKHRCGFEVGKQSSPQEPDAASARSNTPTFAGGTLCGSRWTPASHIAISALRCVPGRPPRRDPDSIPLGGGPLLLFRATPLNSPGSFCAARAVNSAPAPGWGQSAAGAEASQRREGGRRTNAEAGGQRAQKLRRGMQPVSRTTLSPAAILG